MNLLLKIQMQVEEKELEQRVNWLWLELMKVLLQQLKELMSQLQEILLREEDRQERDSSTWEFEQNQ